MLDPELLRKMGAATAAATELVVAVGLGLLVGGWLDGQLGTSPFLLLLLSLVGLLAGFWRLNRWLKGSEQRDGNEPQGPGN
jgi:ATP synthase protein I